MKNTSPARFVPWLILCNLLIVFTASAQENFSMKKGVIYVVRHAEKASGTDPLLTPSGYARCGDLLRTLNKKKYIPERIYVSQFRRTQLTADSLRIQLNIDTIHYIADVSGDGLIKTLTANGHKDERILIVAHSNTIPAILRRLGITNYSGEISESEYDNLFTVTYNKGKAFLFKRKYGKSLLAEVIPLAPECYNRISFKKKNATEK